MHSEIIERLKELLRRLEKPLIDADLRANFMTAWCNAFIAGKKMVSEEVRAREVFALVRGELEKATKKFGPITAPHQGYAIILEELDEAWDAIKTNDMPGAWKEMMQVAAMAIRFMIDLKDGFDGK